MLTKENKIQIYRQNIELYNNHFSQAELFDDSEFALDFLRVSKKAQVRLSRFIVSTYKKAKKTENFIIARESLVKLSEALNSCNHFIEKGNDAIIEKALVKRVQSYEDILNSESKVKTDIIDRIMKFKEQDLPEESRLIYIELKDKNSKIDKDKIDLEGRITLELIYQKRLPQIIQEYVSISEDYKEKFKSYNVNPDSILLDSLNEVKTKVDTILTQNEDVKFDKMRATNKYIKAI